MHDYSTACLKCPTAPSVFRRLQPISLIVPAFSMQVESFNDYQQQLALKTAELEVERGRHQESVVAARQYMAMMVTVNANE